MTCQIQISESQNLGRGRMTGVGVVTRGVALVAAVWHRVHWDAHQIQIGDSSLSSGPKTTYDNIWQHAPFRYADTEEPMEEEENGRDSFCPTET